MKPRPLVVATRGSALALWQARQVAARLESRGTATTLHVVRPIGDVNKTDPLGKLGETGLFTKEVDKELLQGRADLAVHSLKDQETTLADGLVLAMALPRGPVEDALVGAAGIDLAALPAGAVVGTGSLRRRAQLLRLRPDLDVRDIRGNVESRLAQRREGRYDVLIMARAGLERLGLADEIASVLPVNDFLPAPSQGIVGVTCRDDDDAVRECLRRADDAEGHVVGRAERAFLKRLGGGCNVPVGALATLDGDRVALRSRIISLDGRQVIEGRSEGVAGDPEGLGDALAEELLGRGAGDLMRGMRLEGGP